MSAAKHIVFICSRLDLPGGTEKAVISLAGLFAEHKHQVTVLVLDDAVGSFYTVPDGVTVRYENLRFGICPEKSWLARKVDFFQSIRRLRKIWRALKHDVIIATDYPFVVGTVLSGGTRFARCFSWEHHAYGWLKKSARWERLLRYAYPRMHGVICLNEVEAKHYQPFCRRVVVIPNFVSAINAKHATLEEKMILTVGWLIHRKGIDLLLTAAKKVFAKHPDWKWKIIGTGEKEQEVKNFIAESKLEQNLILQSPVSDNLSSEYQEASVFVLPSRIEVFGLVVTEAMAHGLPCIALAKADGPASIIKHLEDGLLVAEDSNELANAVLSLIEHKGQRELYGQKALQNVKRFSPDEIYQKWHQLLS